MEIDKKITQLGQFVDAAFDSHNTAQLGAIQIELKALLGEKLSEIQLATVHFYLSNCFAAYRDLDRSTVGEWDSKNLNNEIYHLRSALKAIRSLSLAQIGTDLRFRIRTNLANALNHVGRSCEAIETWDSAINECPKFGMAICNRAQGLFWYGHALYDNGHKKLFFWKAFEGFKKGLALGVEDHAQAGFKDLLETVRSYGDWDSFDFPLSGERLGKSGGERNYRTWCLENRLFLNPLNDLGPHSIAAHDVITFPSIRIKKDEGGFQPPEVYGVFNQLKQEFCSARYLMFEAINESKQAIHYSDRSVLLYDLLDYREYGLWIEKIKMAFLSSYAIFDKLAYLINQHWNLKRAVGDVTFRSVWLKRGKGQPALHAVFDQMQNWPMRGLYWISKDMFFAADTDRPMAPDARELHYIRNHIAHKYLTVHSDVLYDAMRRRQLEGHEHSYPISEGELKLQAVNLIQLVRSALISVSLAAHRQETLRRDLEDQGLILGIPLFPLSDR